ncbi:MAG: hypothetical protein ACRDDY_02465, partial [Clostridium sp.]|uniref:hypothetical protein n=1 Tax=Clostridium sp. TaxID=1506 RepID=UPI003EE6BF9B
LQYEKSIEKQEDAIDEQTKIATDALDAQIKAIQDYLAKEGKLREDANKLIEGNSKELYDRLSQYNANYVGMTEKQLQDMVNMANSAMDEFGGSVGSVTNAFDKMADAIKDVAKELDKLGDIDIDKDLIEEEVREENKPPSIAEEKAKRRDEVIKQMSENSSAWHGASKEEQARLSKENEKLAKEIGAWKSQKDGSWYVKISGKDYNINKGQGIGIRHSGKKFDARLVQKCA